MENTIRKQLILGKKDFYTKHLNIISNFLPVEFTPKEIDVVASFMSLEGDIAKDRFGTSARKIVREELGISPGGLGNYLRSLKKKNLIVDVDGTTKIQPLLSPATSQQMYMFKLVKDEEV
jgi:DNA-binding MarR family transcriptional regulator